MAELSDYVIMGQLKEHGQTMDWPILVGTARHQKFVAQFHNNGERLSGVAEKLTYVAVRDNGQMTLANDNLPVTLKNEGTRRYKSHSTIENDGVCLVKIHPGTEYGFSPRNRGIHIFTMQDTPSKYLDADAMGDDFVANEKGTQSARERGNKIIHAPGALIFPDYGAFRIPGWIAKEFNGSPEFGFSYSPFTGPRSGEVLHAHREIMEPYIGLEGVLPLFIEIAGGREELTITNGENKEMRYGEIIRIKPGDVALPLPGVPHKLVFDERGSFPFTMYCPNYAPQNLDKTPADDRVVYGKV